LGFLSRKKSNICKICKINPAQRFCLQKGKDICWKCCNEIRVVANCPQSCKFHINKIPTDLTDNEGMTVAVESLSEYEDLQKKIIDQWVLKKQDVLDNRIPIKLIENEEGREAIKAYLSSIHIADSVQYSYQYLKKRLNLSDNFKPIETYETVVKSFLENIIILDYEILTTFIYKNEHYSNMEYKENFIQRIKKIKVFSKLKDFYVIASGINEDGKSALVHIIMNNKTNITFTLLKKSTKWRINNFYIGEPNLVNSENEVYKNIALLFNKNQKLKALETLDKYSLIFINSADLHYYYGIYYLNFAGNFSKAINHYFNSIEIDPDFSESYFGLATAYLLNGDYNNAKKFYLLSFEKNKEDYRALNNLATIFFEENNYKQSYEFVVRALKLNPNFQLAKKNKERILKKLNEL
jgi:tetratricopeptide (TPR) repeat protein